MLRKILYAIVAFMSYAHEKLLSVNNSREFFLNDKQLHFVVIGLLGMLLIFAVYPLFKFLAKKDRIMAVAFIYVFTLIIVITFAIEIGQRATGTGSMEFADIVFGVAGFIALFAVFAVIRALVRAIKKMFFLSDALHAGNPAEDAPKKL